MVSSNAGLHQPGLGFKQNIAWATDELARFSFHTGKYFPFSLSKACFHCFQDNNDDGIWSQVLSIGLLQKLLCFACLA